VDRRKSVTVHRFLSSKETFHYLPEEPEVEPSLVSPNTDPSKGGRGGGKGKGGSFMISGAGGGEQGVPSSPGGEKDKTDLVRNLISRWRSRAPGGSSPNLLAQSPPVATSSVSMTDLYQDGLRSLSTSSPISLPSLSPSPATAPVASSSLLSSSPSSSSSEKKGGSSVGGFHRLELDRISTSSHGHTTGSSTLSSAHTSNGIDKSMLAEGNKSKLLLKTIFAQQALDPKYAMSSVVTCHVVSCHVRQKSDVID
jgi:hypothetical protein